MKLRVKKLAPCLILLLFICGSAALPGSDDPQVAASHQTLATPSRPVVQHVDANSVDRLSTTHALSSSVIHDGTQLNIAKQLSEGSLDQPQPRVGVVNLRPATTYAFQTASAPLGEDGAARGDAGIFCTTSPSQRPSDWLGQPPGTFLGPPVLWTSTKWGLPAGNELPRGSQLAASLDQAISTRSSERRSFTATVLRPVQSISGWPTVPAGSKILGEVAAVEGSQKSDIPRDARGLKLKFWEVRLPNGTSLPLSATLYSIYSASDTIAEASSTRGAPSFRFGSFIKGLTLQAAEDGGYVLSIAGPEVELPARTGLSLQLPLRFVASDRERYPEYRGPAEECH